MTFTKYIYSVLLAVTIGLLLLFFVPSLQNDKNDKIVYDYGVVLQQLNYNEDYLIATLNANYEYIVYLSVYYSSEDYSISNSFLINDIINYYYSYNHSVVSFYLFYEDNGPLYNLYVNFRNDDPMTFDIFSYKVLIMEVSL